ncbi:OB-fold domain-containing protein [Candidatus Roizmanbacteria bacterium]|nr:OB-fold domain-containing protein [Candidatus Roizmanbacteria bacterium]
MISPVKIWRRQREIRKHLGKKGSILAWTIIYVTGTEFKKFAPYPVAIVKLEDGKKITAPLVDYEKENLKLGQKVKVVLRKVREGDHEDVLVYGIKLKPVI